MYRENDELQLRILVVGTGAAGKEIVHGCKRNRWDVTGISRSSQADCPMVHADVLRPGNLPESLGEYDAVVGCLSGTGVKDPSLYRAIYVDGLRNVLNRVHWRSTPRALFLSSTGVYGQEDGSWVDESSETLPLHEPGKVMLDAEKAVRDAVEESCAVRLSGLYGRGRTRLVRQAGRMGPVPKSDVWANQIRLEDVGNVVTHLLTLSELPPVVLASDDQPARRETIIRWIREQKTASDGWIDEPHPQRVGRNRGNKRVSNALMRSLGCPLQFPDFRSGYADLI